MTSKLSSAGFTVEFLRTKVVTDGILFVKPTDEDIAGFDYRQVLERTIMSENLCRGMLKFDLVSFMAVAGILVVMFFICRTFSL